MKIDLELYRREVTLRQTPQVRLSVIDIAPEQPRRTFVLVHGFGGQASQWRYQLQHFSLKNRVIAFDQRGHGRTPTLPAPDFSMDEAVDDLRRLVQALNVQTPFVLVGHSFGGAVVTEYAVRYPEGVSHLVLIATAGEFRLNPLYRLALNLPATVLRLLRPFTRRWLAASPAALRPWYRNILSCWNGWSRFRDLTVPTLVIRGHRDIVFARPLFEEVARVIPGAEDVDVGASGHMVMLERRDAVNRAIRRFLRESSHRTWRENGGGEDPRADLLRERPWLVHYEDQTPYTVAVPDVPLYQFLRSAARRFGGVPR